MCCVDVQVRVRHSTNLAAHATPLIAMTIATRMVNMGRVLIDPGKIYNIFGRSPQKENSKRVQDRPNSYEFGRGLGGKI